LRLGWRCIPRAPMRICSRNSPTVCRGRRDGSSRGLLRRNRLSFKHVHDWGTNRYVICSPASLVPSPVRTRPAPGLPVDGWPRSTEPVSTCPTRPRMQTFSGGRPPVAASSPRSRKRGWSRWPNAARTRSSTPCSGRRTSEIEMARALAGRLEPGMLVLADRGLYGFKLWSQAAGTGADLLWRVKTTLRPRHVQTLPDGSWLARIVATSGANRARTPPLNVRVVDYTIDDGRDNPEHYRLLTTILDPDQAIATQLASAYAQRWEIESVFDELKSHQRGPRAVLRSESPQLVQQEMWGHLCCHYAIRTLMLDAATHAGHDPDRISFVAALRITRRSLSHSSFSPSQP